MSLKLKPVSRKNPLKPTAPPLFYLNAVSKGKVNLDDICKRVAHASTLSRGDLFNAILSIVDEMIFDLNDGKIVELGKLGTFRMTVNSTGVPELTKVSSNQVTKVNIRFRPSSELTGTVKNLQMEM
jgi:predicted histone-like DNA-binding protein